MTTFTQAVAALAIADKATVGKLAKVAPLYLAQVKASDEKTVNLQFRRAYMAAHSDKSAAIVEAWLADDTITKREGSTPMHLAYNAAKMALSRLRKLAGLAATGKRKAKPAEAPASVEAPAPAAISVKEFVAETCPSTSDLLAQVDLFAAALSHLQKKNAKATKGELGSAITRAIAEFVANVNAAHEIAKSEKVHATESEPVKQAA